MQLAVKKKTWAVLLVLLTCLVAAGGASAAADVTAATASLTDAKTAVEAIGPLMLQVVGAGIVFKWILGFII